MKEEPTRIWDCANKVLNDLPSNEIEISRKVRETFKRLPIMQRKHKEVTCSPAEYRRKQKALRIKAAKR